jgi:hypothetical protein
MKAKFQMHYKLLISHKDFKLNIWRLLEPEYRSLYSDWLWAETPRGQSSSLGRVKIFLNIIQTNSGGHSAYSPIGTGGSILWSEVARA